jgi:hypothetical protein
VFVSIRLVAWSAWNEVNSSSNRILDSSTAYFCAIIQAAEAVMPVTREWSIQRQFWQSQVPCALGTINMTWKFFSSACPDYDGSTVYYPAHESTGALIKAHAENIQNLAKREERLRFIMSLVTDQLPRFGSKTDRVEMATSGPVTKRPSSDDALSAIAGDSQAARDFRKAPARHHPEVRIPEHLRAMRRPESWEEDLEIMPGMMRAAIEIRLLLALSFLFCVLALFFIYQAAFPSKKVRAVAPQECVARVF